MGDITEPLNASAEELREIVLERVAAVKAKDPGVLAARQAADLITFDVIASLRSRGSETDTQRTRSWFDGYASEIGY